MGMQTPMTEQQIVEGRAVRNQGRLVAAAWAMAALLAVLVVVLLVQGARIADLERSVQTQPSDGFSGSDPSVTMQLDEVCQLLGALAQKADVPLASVFDGETMTTCEAQAGTGASKVRAAG